MKRKNKIVPVEIKLIRSCEDLMLDKFKHCLLKEEYSPLIISGQPSETELNDAWNFIISEFALLSGNEKFERMITLTREINAAVLKFNRVEIYVRILLRAVDEPSMFSEVLVKELKRYGYPGQYDPKIKSRYVDELEAAYSKAKSLLVSAKLKQDELKKLEKEMLAGKADSQYFDKSLIDLSGFYKYQVLEHNISVQKFCLMVKDMNRIIKLQNSKNGRPAYTGNNK
jgi:hypothetical protein